MAYTNHGTWHGPGTPALPRLTPSSTASQHHINVEAAFPSLGAAFDDELARLVRETVRRRGTGVI